MDRYLCAVAVARAEHPETAMASRAAVERGKGVMTERFELSSGLAFEALARASMARTTELRDVAADVITTGESPPG